MGLYINPKNKSKEEWLEDNNIDVSTHPFDFEDIGDDNHIICLVDNGMFTAAAVAYDIREYEDFKYNDGRFKVWFIVPKENIKAVCPDYDIFVNTVD